MLLSLFPYYSDADNDGKKEIAVDAFVGGGTGGPFSELQITQKDNTDHSLVDYQIPYDIFEKVREKLSL